MLFECFGSGLFGHLVSQFDEFYDGGRQSMSDIEAAASALPTEVGALNALGLRYLQDAKPHLAERAFRRSLQVNPKNAFARVGMACALYEQRKAQSALDEITACLETHPDYAPATASARFIRLHLGDDHAVQDLHEALSVH